jgi:hypothetical protein
LEVFGTKFNSDSIAYAVDNTNTNYGGYNYQGSRVLFVNGEIDPWHALSFYKQSPNPETNIAFIKGTAHCADMYPTSVTDPVQLTAARQYTEAMLGTWLK